MLERGRLIETGSHAKLMNSGGRYASLYRAHQVLEMPMQRPPTLTPVEVAHVY